MIKAATKLLSASQFMLLPAPSNGARQELLLGKVVSMPPPSFQHGEVQLAIGALLQAFIRKHQLGRIVTESGVRTTRRPDSVRGPDLAFWSKQRLPLNAEVEGYPEVPADLIVEIVSESKRRRAMRRKLKEYFDSGVKLIWVVDIESHSVSVFQKAGKGITLLEDNEIDGGNVLPGFRCNISDFFN